MMMASRRIILPLPDKWLKPNTTIASMAGRMAKSSATKKYREQACEQAKKVDSTFGPHEHCEVQCFFYFKDARRRDKDNCLASMKAAFDGIADAGWVADDADFTHLPVQINKDKDRPRVEIVVTAASIAGKVECTDSKSNFEIDRD
jgi:Holliday junction resolvase RusA-like endonuclease